MLGCTGETLRLPGFHLWPLWPPALLLTTWLPYLGPSQSPGAMRGFHHDCSSIHSWALSPFGCLLCAGPRVRRIWGPREEGEGTLLSWIIQSRQ